MPAESQVRYGTNKFGAVVLGLDPQSSLSFNLNSNLSLIYSTKLKNLKWSKLGRIQYQIVGPTLVNYFGPTFFFKQVLCDVSFGTFHHGASTQN
jgi:hypothetical protein